MIVREYMRWLKFPPKPVDPLHWQPCQGGGTILMGFGAELH
jgi:hypothetical protein